MIKVIEEVVSSKQDIEKYGDKDSTDIENDVEDFREDGDDIKKKVANKKDNDDIPKHVVASKDGDKVDNTIYIIKQKAIQFPTYVVVSKV